MHLIGRPPRGGTSVRPSFRHRAHPARPTLVGRQSAGAPGRPMRPRLASTPRALVMGSGWQLGRTRGRARGSDHPGARSRRLPRSNHRSRSPLLSRIHDGAARPPRPPGPGRTTSEVARKRKQTFHTLSAALAIRELACMHVCLRRSNQAVIIPIACTARPGWRPAGAGPTPGHGQPRYMHGSTRHGPGLQISRGDERVAVTCTLAGCRLLACSSKIFSSFYSRQSFFRSARDGLTGACQCNRWRVYSGSLYYRGGGFQYSCSSSDLGHRPDPDCVTALFSAMRLSFVRGLMGPIDHSLTIYEEAVAH